VPALTQPHARGPRAAPRLTRALAGGGGRARRRGKSRDAVAAGAGAEAAPLIDAAGDAAPEVRVEVAELAGGAEGWAGPAGSPESGAAARGGREEV
jgi:hypothetical protein